MPALAENHRIRPPMGSLIGSVLAGATAVVFAVLMILSRSLYASAMCLMVVLVQASVLFYFSGSPMMGFLQIMIYAGAVMVLVVVTIMAAPAKVERRWGGISLPQPLAIGGLLLPVVEVLLMMNRADPAGTMVRTHASGAQDALGAVLFGPYAIATEAVGLLLFVSALAMVDGQKE